ncbi:MAG: transcriptional regulator NrdR, partial [Actinomycetes bacterium]
VEEALRESGRAEIEAQEVGLAILAPLRELDEVAYLRYASVYRAFESLEDFEAEISLLRAIPATNSNSNFSSGSNNAKTNNSSPSNALQSGYANSVALSSID